MKIWHDNSYNAVFVSEPNVYEYHQDDDDEWGSLKIMYVFILLKADKGVTFLWLYTLFPIKERRKKESHHWDLYLYLFDLHMWKNERNLV